jgi:hypothetical protein
MIVHHPHIDGHRTLLDRSLGHPSGTLPVMRVGIEIGSATTKAIVTTADGGRIPLMPDGFAHMSTGVFIDPATDRPLVGTSARAAGLDQPHLYIRDPIQHLAHGHVDVGGHSVAAVDLCTAILETVQREATRVTGHAITSAAIAVPPDWGPKRRATLEQAANRAGFTDPTFVAAPAAVATYLASTTGQAWKTGDCLLVCDAGASTLRLTVLQQTATGFTQLATARVDDAGGHTVDALISRQLLDRAVGSATWLRPTDNDHQADFDPLLTSTQLAKEQLAATTQTAVALPPPHPPAALSRADLTAILEPVYDRVRTTIADVIASADVDSSHLAAVILTGGGAHLPGLATALTTATGRPPITPDRVDLAAADGALTATTGTRSPVPPIRLPTIRLRAADLVRPVLAGVSSLALFAFTLMTVWISGDGRLAADVHVATELVSAAAAVAVLTAWSAAHLIPTLALAGNTAETRTATLIIRRAFTIAAGFGVTVAVIYGLAVGALLGATTTEYLTASLAAVPIAALALLIAALAPAVPPAAVPNWLVNLRPAIPPIVLGGAGLVIMRYAVTQPGNLVPGGADLFLRFGAALAGIAIALTVTRSPLIRMAGAALLGVGGLIVASMQNSRLITLAYVAATTWWAATAAARTVRSAYPSLHSYFRATIRSREE